VSRRNIYSLIIEKVFQSKFKLGMREVEFEREDLLRFARKYKIRLPRNIGDLIYSFRFRNALPEAIQKSAAQGQGWVIRLAGRGKYRFVLLPSVALLPNRNIAITKVPDATPGVVAKYAFNDEQALLAKVRYNRLVDVFTGVACYSLQNHLRTTVPGIGQVETDELYVGVDKKGVHYVLPIQAKGGRDKLSVVQVEQDLAVCAHKCPSLVCRPVGALFMTDDTIALFEFEESDNGIGIVAERHYKLVPPEEVTEADLEVYRSRVSDRDSSEGAGLVFAA
jgi:hypothetical protein